MPPVERMPGVIAARPRTEEYFALRDTLQGTTHEVAVVEHVVRDELGGINAGDEVAVFVPLEASGIPPEDLLDIAKDAAVAGGYMAAPSDWAHVIQGLTYLRPGETSPIQETSVAEKVHRIASLIRRIFRLAA